MSESKSKKSYISLFSTNLFHGTAGLLFAQSSGVLFIYINTTVHKDSSNNLFAFACTLFHRDFSPNNGAYLPLVIPEYI